MKELSIEEKAKAYDKRLEKAQKWYDINTNKGYRSIFEDIFPELKESEDERIRKEIKQFIRSRGMQLAQSKVESWIAWLEKQGENNMGISEATKKKLEDSLNEALEKETPESFNKFLDEQGEQKPDNELKFEIDDLITNGILVGKIDEIHELGYHAYFGDHYADVPDVENWHKWTIQDAKAGDVLAWDNGRYTIIFKELKDNKIIAHCSYNNHSEHFETQGNYDTVFDSDFKFIPGTKKQHDLLFQKMREAGYEWDVEKKELKKVEQKQVIDYPDSLPKDNWELVHEFVSKFGRVPKDEDELNVLVEYVLERKNHSEWSEEDEQYKSGLIGLVENSKAGLPINLRGKAADKCIYWLKSLKDRYAWKPSDEQMKALHAKLSYVNSDRELVPDVILESLYNDLKKLREE